MRVFLFLRLLQLVQATGLFSAGFCHKGGFLMTAGTLEDAVAACKISLSCFKEEPVIVNFGGGKEADELLQQLPGMEHARISHCALRRAAIHHGQALPF